MKRLLLIFLSLSVAVSTFARQTDSLALASLGVKLGEYYEAMKYESPDVQAQECDFLIESTADSIVRQYVTLDIYNHYLESPVMGAENVAVHVFDRWIGTGKVRMRSNSDYLKAQVHADFNRRSLLGKRAQPLLMQTAEGDLLELFGKDDASEGFRILYFYDTDCARCKVESLLLNSLLSTLEYPVEIYAVYAGDNRENWDSYVSKVLNDRQIVHLWDPELVSDFQRKYGVIKTPRMFLIAPDGIIIGRGLDTESLKVLLDGISRSDELTYGSQESSDLFDGIFSASTSGPSVDDVKDIADYIRKRTLDAGDKRAFRQMAGDYLYYLSMQNGEGYKEGLKYHIERNILSDDGVWTSQDDSLKVIEYALMISDMLSLNVPGSRITSVEVPGVLHTWRKVRQTVTPLDMLGGENNIIIFHTEGCQVCAAEKEASLAMLSAGKDRSVTRAERRKARKVNVFMVNVDRIMETDPRLAMTLLDSFDLSVLPFIIMTDSQGRILRRYMSLL